MAVELYRNGAFRLLAQHIYQNRHGTWCYRRRIPDDLKRHYPSNNSGQIRYSFKTKDRVEAARKADAETRKLDALWRSIRTGEVEHGPEEYDAALALLAKYDLKPGDWERWKAADLEPDDFLRELDYQAGVVQGDTNAEVEQKRRHDMPSVFRVAADLYYGEKKPIFLLDALAEFQRVKNKDMETSGEKGRLRVVNEFINLFGHLPIDQYTRDNANEYVRHLRDVRKNKPASIVRRINSISAVIAFMIAEGKLSERNIFDKLTIEGRGKTANARQPFTPDELRRLQSLCIDKDDEMRWAIAFISDSGSRVAEVIGLRVKDVFPDAPVPYVSIRESESRSLKTEASNRDMPLVGASLWAAQRAVHNAKDGFLFPRYIDFSVSPPQTKATHASNALNKWIRGQGIDKTCHSFRHSFNDRLRAAGVPEDMRKAMGGWKNPGVEAGYGSGYTLEKKAEYVRRIVLEELRFASAPTAQDRS